jgi:ribosomal protein L11 methyltransferase
LLEDATIAGRTVLDLGCGSGILSIASSKLGAARVLGVDVDPLSVEVAKENATANHVAATFQSGEGFAEIEETWDVVVSNIISAVLIRLAPEAFRVVSPGGTWIVSGIIHDNWPDVRKAAESVGFTLTTQRREDDWVAASFARP